MDDRVAQLVDQWTRERPDVDVATMATVARLLGTADLARAAIGTLAASYDLTTAEGDVLFALRRSGPPYRLLPSRLSAALLVSSGTMTSRLDRLERGGLIDRTTVPEDRRAVAVSLTERGREVTDEALTRHMAAEERMLAPLSERERRTLDRLLRKVADGFDERVGTP
ncbi:hypothetical protein DSM112329_01199 [Paraconexibacter sp. AEG42_29]|uniref:HTH marR-type domain-containing protein n=1 Tax=Paraconexibacter sp. AEG42_29 TaxID=2997339 RepID=A0AAU7ARU6_9ACTN